MRRSPCFAACGGAVLLGLSTAAGAAPQTYTVVIQKMKFGPLPAQVRKGDSIIWVNRDILRHIATAADHSFDVDLPAGAKGKTLIRKAGTIAFTCRYHPGMRGTLKVR